MSMSLTSHSSPAVRVAARLVRTLLPADVYRGIGDARQRSRFRRTFGIDGNELDSLLEAPRFRPTPFHLLNREITLTDALGGHQCIQELLIEEAYRFRATQPRIKILDCGANIGLSVIYFKHLYPDSEIIAFEPDPEIFRVLDMNLRPFEYTDVTLRREAVWKADGELNFVPDGGFGGRTESAQTIGTAAVVKAVRLRDFLDKPITLLKIDIEGAEVDVIEDCRDHLANVERLFVEFHGRLDRPQRLGEMLEHIKHAGFRYYCKEAGGIRHPFLPEERKGDLYDLQLNIFASRD